MEGHACLLLECPASPRPAPPRPLRPTALLRQFSASAGRVCAGGAARLAWSLAPIMAM